MGNQCTSETNTSGTDVPYYDIKLKGCYADPSDYFKLQVSSEAKRRYVLDHIRYTIAQRRKDSAFQRSMGPPPIPIDAISFAANESTQPQLTDPKSINAVLAAFCESATSTNLADPLTPFLLDKTRVVAELEETTHERLIAALVRSRRAIEAAFVLPMEAAVEEPLAKHQYQKGAVPRKGGIVHKSEAAAFAEANNDEQDGKATSNPEPKKSDAPPKPATAQVPVVSCIPWQVARLSWLTTLELVTLDIGDKVAPHLKKSSTVTKGEEANYNSHHSEYDEFSMLRSDGSKGGMMPSKGTSNGPPNGDQPALTPSSTVEVAFVEFTVDKSMQRALRWNAERKAVADRYLHATEPHQHEGPKRRKSIGFQDDANEQEPVARAGAAAATTTTATHQSQRLSPQVAGQLARRLVDHQRIGALHGMVATRSLVGPDHPMFTSLWSNPFSPAVATELAARFPQLTLARSTPLPGIVMGATVEERLLYGADAAQPASEEKAIAEAVAEFSSANAPDSSRVPFFHTNSSFQTELLNQLQRNANSNTPASAQPEESLYDNASMIGVAQPSAQRNGGSANATTTDRANNAQRVDGLHPHCCMCQSCVEKLWVDIDLRHLVTWPPTACVARPTISVLSHTTSVEAVIVVPKNNGRVAEDRPPQPGQETTLQQDEEFEMLDLADGGNATQHAPRHDIKFVRRHRATVMVLFYHHRLRTSNAVQRRLLAEDTCSIPLLQPEASASSSMLLSRGNNEGNHLLARKARLQMLSNYRDLKAQQMEGEAVRRRQIGDGASTSGGGKDGNGAAALPAPLAAMATSMSAGECTLNADEAKGAFTNLIQKRREAAKANGSYHAAGQALVGEANDGDVEMSDVAPPRPGVNQATSLPSSASTLHPSKVLAVCPSSLPNGTSPPPNIGIDIELSSVSNGAHHYPAANVVVTAFAKADLPHFPANGQLFSTTKSSNGERLGGANDSTPMGPTLRTAATKQPHRLDAVDVVVEALCIDLEAFELFDDSQTTAQRNVGANTSILAALSAQYEGGKDVSQAPIIMGARRLSATDGTASLSGIKCMPTTFEGNFAAPEVSLMATLAPAVDLRKAAAGDNFGNNLNTKNKTALKSPVEGDQNGRPSGLTFKEPPPTVVTPEAAMVEGAVNKNAMRTERRKDVDRDDVINGTLNAPNSKAGDSEEGVRTKLALRMMAAHYQSKMDEQHQQKYKGSAAGGLPQQLQHLQHDMSQFQSYLAQVAFQVQTEIWMKDLFPL